MATPKVTENPKAVTDLVEAMMANQRWWSSAVWALSNEVEHRTQATAEQLRYVSVAIEDGRVEQAVKVLSYLLGH
jgi:hypothetical protein